MNPTLRIKFLYIQQRQASGLHCLILLIKEASVSQLFISFSIKLHMYRIEFGPL